MMTNNNIYRYLDGEMSPDERSAFLQEVAVDPALAQELAETRMLLGVARTSRMVPIPLATQHAVLTAISQPAATGVVFATFGSRLAAMKSPAMIGAAVAIIVGAFGAGWFLRESVSPNAAGSQPHAFGRMVDETVSSREHGSPSYRQKSAVAEPTDELRGEHHAASSWRMVRGTKAHAAMRRSAGLGANASTNGSANANEKIMAPASASTEYETRHLVSGAPRYAEQPPLPVRGSEDVTVNMVEEPLSSLREYVPETSAPRALYVSIRSMFNDNTSMPELVPNNIYRPQYAVTASYALNSEHMVSVATGFEPMLLSYTLEQNARLFTVDQQSTALWFALGYRYEPRIAQLPSSVRPYGEVLLGGWQGGPMLRASFGVSVGLLDWLDLTGGYEGSAFVYTVNDAAKVASRPTWTTGVRVRFGMPTL